ncbi:DUF2567 domain-containing protein [Streptomyces sp. LP05-1]|uniref:DUF2567 domain-containing protein n=1 Tax=Streptomyces pyxinae TaxID=2970734 RepID=A0ABT2CG92_9ACTN|nr:DUF2567 domain-containing protein [Streptomyces sp. LP05-1]MCS0636428.1 DUF2567 domain-containing protein [Streptomyces sp. LP05-1]
MTAPQTPSPKPPSDSAWPPPGTSAAITRDAETPDVATEVRQGLMVFLLVALGGVALGLLWLWLAPRVPLISDSRAVFLKESEGENAVGADGTFALLGLGLGVLSAAVVFWFRRRGGVAVVVGLALGGLAGSFLGWGLGTLLGPTHDVVAHARSAGPGVVFDAPLELQAHGALLAWPIAAMVVHLALTALFTPRDPEPVAPWSPEPYAHRDQPADGHRHLPEDGHRDPARGADAPGEGRRP